MKRYPSLIAAGLMLGAVAQLQTQAVANTWNNFTANFLWSTNAPDQNWTSPTTWIGGDDAIFGATGVGAVSLSTPVLAHSITVNSAGYSINAFPSGNTLTLAGSTPTITNNANVTMAVTIRGTNGVTYRGTGVTVLRGDSGAGQANAYTNGTYVRSGTLVLQCTNAVYPGHSSSGVSYAVDSIEALDPGATVKYGTIDDGLGNHVSMPKGQIAAGAPNFVSRLHLTGGTFDLNGDARTQGAEIPCPDGFGTIINTSSNVASAMIIVGDGQDHEFSGHIMDGGSVQTNANYPGQFGYQIGILDLHYGIGGYTLTLSGSNSFSGSIRCGNASIKLSGAGTLGLPSPITGVTGPMRISNGQHIDLNGTSQTIGTIGSAGSTDHSGQIYNSAVGTVSTLTFGVGDNLNTTPSQIIDNPGTGGVLALTKIGTGQQGFYGTNANTYSGDTTISNGLLGFQAVSAVSPNTNFRLFTAAGTLMLNYDGTADVKGLYVDGAEQPNGIYDETSFPAFPDMITGAGLVRVVGNRLNFSQSGNQLTCSWVKPNSKLQAQTNSITGTWSDYPGGGSSPVNVTINPANGSVFYRLAPLP